MIGPVEPSIDRDYIGRVFAIVVLGGMGSIGGTLVAALILGVSESFVATFSGPSWSPAVSFGILLIALALRPQGLFGRYDAWPASSGRVAAHLAGDARRQAARRNRYFYFAGYGILQYVVIAIAWNILGGYTGYVNFGSAGFFAIGAYTSVVPVQGDQRAAAGADRWGGLVGGLLGLGIGYLTLRLRGVFFSIATLALAIVLETVINNWEYVGGAPAGASSPPPTVLLFDNYVEFLFA